MNQLYYTAVIVLILGLIVAAPCEAESSADMFPRIEELNYSDLNYRQLQEDIEFYYRAAGAGKELPPLIFYSYKVKEGEDIFSLAAQSGLPYEAIVSLNGISSSNSSIEGRMVLIPSQAGIFLPENPMNDLEIIALSWRGEQINESSLIEIGKKRYFFLEGESFHNVERAYFLGILFTTPLAEGIVTSGYGLRQNPFGGHRVFHNGIDIAAPPGSAVYAAREGTVTDTGYNVIFGNYIEIQHEGGYSTFYGHLNKIFVELHYQVNSTMIIAEVGSTGRSTGPHLHFEIRKDGQARNPSLLTPGLK